jgi:Kef-type K+ transport system membrane component KefB
MYAGTLLLQLAVIIAAARLFGILFKRLRQPVVMGEMVAGIVLGPSVFGAAFPGFHAALFSGETRAAVTLIAQLGVALFMFVVGTRVELDTCRRHSRAIVAIATASITLPFILGAALGVPLHDAFVPPSVPRLPFVLFIATAMSVTAFPVLARIVVERRLEGSVPGNTALVCAAINDAVAWILVASVAGLVAGDDQVQIPLAVHGIFVAFVTGAACAAWIPEFARLAAKVEVPASRLTLPVFFALTGLRTDLRLLAVGAGSWLWCVAIIATATAGKFGGATAAALAAGMPRSQALTLGALMNTRGLMELVVLSMGYELGLLPPAVFAMMVVMALVTTCAAGPLVDRWSRDYRSASAVATP